MPPPYSGTSLPLNIDIFDGGGKNENDPKKHFAAVLEKFNPQVFGRGSGFTRHCPNNNYRWPVAITKSELERIKIEKSYSGIKSFTNLIKSYNVYDLGDEQYQNYNGEAIYFICPKFWDMKRRMSVREDLVYNSFITINQKDKDLKKKFIQEFNIDDELSETIIQNYNS